MPIVKKKTPAVRRERKSEITAGVYVLPGKSISIQSLVLRVILPPLGWQVKNGFRKSSRNPALFGWWR
jgi:hypothetical protein